MLHYAVEQLGPKQARLANGALLCRDVCVGRSGWHRYAASELLTDSAGAFGWLDVLRPDAEVFSDRAMRSYEGTPVTLGHPPVEVTADNWRQLAVGTVGNVRRDGHRLMADLLIHDAEASRRSATARGA